MKWAKLFHQKIRCVMMVMIRIWLSLPIKERRHSLISPTVYQMMRVFGWMMLLHLAALQGYDHKGMGITARGAWDL